MLFCPSIEAKVLKCRKYHPFRNIGKRTSNPNNSHMTRGDLRCGTSHGDITWQLFCAGDTTSIRENLDTDFTNIGFYFQTKEFESLCVHSLSQTTTGPGRRRAMHQICAQHTILSHAVQYALHPAIHSGLYQVAMVETEPCPHNGDFVHWFTLALLIIGSPCLLHGWGHGRISMC